MLPLSPIAQWSKDTKPSTSMGSQPAESTITTPHVLMVSFPGQGHVNPLLRFAKRIAAKGMLVTFTSTADIGHKIIQSTANSAPGVPMSVGRGFLRFEFFSDKWTFDYPDTSNLDFLMANLRTYGPLALAELLRHQEDAGRPVSCLINNPFVPWVLDVAADMDIPSGILWVQSCCVFSTYYHFYHSLAEYPTEANPDVTVHLPGIPAMKPDELPSFLLPTSPYPSLTKVILEQFENVSKASWVFVNSFEELEREAIEAMSERVPLISVGPLVEPDEESQPSIRGDMYKAADCMEWLDKQEPRSVVYVSVGSIVVLSKEEMAEMACGLKNSGQPFLWVVRKDTQALLPEGFLEDIGDKGMVVEWSPQDRVLEHAAVACFVTHCGWNSTLETLTAGVPVITYPQWGDQVTDSKFLVDVFGVGVRLKSPATREQVEQCVAALTKGAEAEALRRKAQEWSAAARKAGASGGSSDRNIQAFVDEMQRRTGGAGGK